MVTKRRVIKGVSISSGIAMGTTRVVHPGFLNVAEIPITLAKVKPEIDALEEAVRETIAELEHLRDTAGKKTGASVAKIFEAQLLIAGDLDFLAQVKQQIKTRRRNAGFVYNTLVNETIRALDNSPDQYMRQMVQEIEAVTNKVLSHLTGFGEKSTARLPDNTILVAQSFSASDIMDYRSRRAAGFITAEGGSNSHMALIARSLMLPATLSNNALSQIPNACRVIVDGTNGKVIVRPSDDDWSEYLKKRKLQGPAIISRIKKLEEIPPKTADGVPVNVAANLEIPGPADDLLSDARIPVGLYRTEFLYLEHVDFPGEAAQFEYYSRIAERFANTHVILRTFDLGSDKVKDDGLMPAEDNPALGWRGIRSMLDMPQIFKTQIRAILRASTLKNVKILLPMVSDVSELRKAKKYVSQVMLELRRKGIPFDNDIEIGVMVEIPSAALTANQLARDADFVSIGTNDLTQYTMSADRNNSRVAGLYSHFHPSVLSLIHMTVMACRRHGTPVQICGESAGDPLALPLFIGMGVSGLSMNPTKIFDACRLIKRIDFEMVRHLVDPVLASKSVAAVVRKLQNYRNAVEGK